MKIQLSTKPAGKTGRLTGRMRVLFAAGAMLSSVWLFGQNGEALFKQNCSACHSIGKGKLVGPDLKGVTDKRKPEWLQQWIKSSTALIGTGDADAKAIFAEFNNMTMPDQALSDGDISGIIAYLKDAGGAGAAATADAAPAAPVRSTDDATAAEIAAGQDLFQGSQSFKNGGPSCISCHNVSYNGVIPGGLLAKDLTEAYSRVGGDAGLTGLLGSPAFPAMQVAFGDHKLTDTEIYDLTAFLNKVNKDTANRATAQGSPLLYGGVPGLVVLLVFIFVIWFSRKKASVKQEIYARQIKSRN